MERMFKNILRLKLNCSLPRSCVYIFDESKVFISKMHLRPIRKTKNFHEKSSWWMHSLFDEYKIRHFMLIFGTFMEWIHEEKKTHKNLICLAHNLAPSILRRLWFFCCECGYRWTGKQIHTCECIIFFMVVRNAHYRPTFLLSIV